MFNPILNMETAKSIILAIDWGERRLGLALSDDLRIMAHPYGTVENGDRIYEEIGEISRERDVGLILLGLPLTLAGEEGEMAQKVREFGTTLAGYLEDVPITYFDERLTTSAAEKIVRDIRKKGFHKNKRGKNINVDAVAAALLLEMYLDSTRNHHGESITEE